MRQSARPSVHPPQVESPARGSDRTPAGQRRRVRRLAGDPAQPRPRDPGTPAGRVRVVDPDAVLVVGPRVVRHHHPVGHGRHRGEPLVRAAAQPDRRRPVAVALPRTDGPLVDRPRRRGRDHQSDATDRAAFTNLGAPCRTAAPVGSGAASSGRRHSPRPATEKRSGLRPSAGQALASRSSPRKSW